MKNEKNLELTKRFDEVYPGPHSNLRVSLQTHRSSVSRYAAQEHFRDRKIDRNVKGTSE